MSTTRTFRVVVFKDGDFFIASALEVDIAAQGATLEEALLNLKTSFFAELREAENNGTDILDLGPAPEKIITLFEGNSRDALARDKIAA